jgi:hypothetical protein
MEVKCSRTCTYFCCVSDDDWSASVFLDIGLLYTVGGLDWSRQYNYIDLGSVGLWLTLLLTTK